MNKYMPLLLAGVLALGPLAVSTPVHISSLSNAYEVKAGQFCKKADIGKTKTADNGAKVKCKKDGSRSRWKAVS